MAFRDALNYVQRRCALKRTHHNQLVEGIETEVVGIVVVGTVVVVDTAP